jgi:hypothetical protein
LGKFVIQTDLNKFEEKQKRNANGDEVEMEDVEASGDDVEAIQD